jgi:3-dehydroquinate synthase
LELKHFNFGISQTTAHIASDIPGINDIAADFGSAYFKPLLICDKNTLYLAKKIKGSTEIPYCILEPGEPSKKWDSVETILRHARNAGMGRDGIFIGIGGGVICDLAAFAVSIYMRGCPLALVATSLLCVADACIGGKTGFDLFGIKNLAGTFYPARHVYMPLDSLNSLPPAEWKSGMAELIKAAILGGDDTLDDFFAMTSLFPAGSFNGNFPEDFALRLCSSSSDLLLRCIEHSVQLKGRIVQEDPLETGSSRILLNLGHTFGHALETSAGLGKIPHGEAVAWGIARSCDLGLKLGCCPSRRAEQIKALLAAFGYETAARHPLMGSADVFFGALINDKKNRGGKITFIVPDEKSAHPESIDISSLKKIIFLINGVSPS